MEIPRDRMKRPLIRPVDGGPKLVPYTRASTLAKALDDTYNLEQWKTRLAVLGVATNRHLMQQIAGVASRYDDPVKQGKGELNALADQAFEAAGGTASAATGTALHDFTEQIDAGREVTNVPSEFRVALQKYREATKGLQALEAEVFVVNDTLKVAGSLDRLWRLPDGSVRVGDLKSGDNEPDYPLGVITQVAIYAHSQRYDPATGERSPLHPDIDLATGLLIHLPIRAVDENGVPAVRCDLFDLDLGIGMAAANLALEVRTMRRKKSVKRFEIPEPTLWDEAS